MLAQNYGRVVLTGSTGMFGMTDNLSYATSSERNAAHDREHRLAAPRARQGTQQLGSLGRGRRNRDPQLHHPGEAGPLRPAGADRQELRPRDSARQVRPVSPRRLADQPGARDDPAAVGLG